MAYDLRFVDSIASSPTTRLDLYGTGWTVRDTTSFGMPELKRAVAGATLLTDGETYPAAAYSNRTLRLELRIDGASDDAIAALFQDLMAELDRPTNILRYKTDTTDPVFFRTFRAGPENVDWRPYTKELTALIPAEPFAYGIKETLSAVTVYNDPADGTTLNSNPFFETTASPWTALGGTVARSTAQAHEGTASLLLTPDGVTATVEARSENVAAAAGQQFRSSAWVRCDVARSVSVGIVWRDAANAFISSSLASVAVAATTWTLIDGTATAPASTAFAQITVAMGSTPPASHLLYIDEARLRRAGGAGGCCFDVTGIKGDFETPLYLRLGTDFMAGSASDYHALVMGIRRRGTPSSAPFVLQAESMTTGTATALGAANDTAMSGSGQNYMRVTPLNTDLDQRLYMDPFPTSAGVDVRGRYRVLVRVRQSSVLDQWAMRLTYGPLGSLQVDNDTVTLAQSTAIRYVDLGTIQYPYGEDPQTDGISGVELSTKGVRVAVYAQRASGTGTLDIDLLLFVPADDAYTPAKIYRDTGVAAGIIDGHQTMAYAVGASGEIVPPYAPNQVSSGCPSVSPGVTNRVAFLADGGHVADSALTATWTLTPYYWPRYGYVRGVGG